ncbi:hypothetical protein [Clostridium rectalis]|uniref:hypothetical protein n=1 Tax=Clostridium rectalis TaxID=2040295 RepID=UPI000F6420EC|nr:hypothetical protein [Clostridium rectalis]
MNIYSKILDKFIKKANDNFYNKWLKYGLLSWKKLSELDIDKFDDWCCEFLININCKSVSTIYKSYENNLIIISCIKNHEPYHVLCKLSQNKSDSFEKFDTLSLNEAYMFVGDMLENNITKGLILSTGEYTNEILQYINLISDKYLIDLLDGVTLTNEHRKIRNKKISLFLQSQSYL